MVESMVGLHDTRVVCPTLIGRTRELEVLERAFTRTRGGHGHALMLAGTAGMGKSRLVTELKARIWPDPSRMPPSAALILQGGCVETDRGFPYAPILDIARTYLASCSTAELADSLGTDAPEIVKLIPELSARLPGLLPSAEIEPEQEKRRLHHALAQWCFRLSRRHPLCVIVEDLHWSDAASLEFLLFLARRVAAHPILLLFTYRGDDVGPELAPWLAELDRERLADELTLLPLTIDEVDAMVRAIFDLPRPVSADFLATLFALTEGNPFFVEEVLKSLIAAGEIFHNGKAWDRKPLDELHIPRSVRVAVQRRLDRLPPEARRLLALAAVAGRRFNFSLLRRLTQHDEPRLLELMKQTIAAQLVVEESAEVFAFRHALTRQAVYAELLVRERKALHRLIGETIEQTFAEALDEHLVELAYHFYEAEVWVNVLEYARRAAARARSLHSPRAEVDYLTRAIEAVGRLGMAAHGALHRARGQAHELLGAFQAACDDYTRALDAAIQGRDLPAEWQSLLDLGDLWRERDYQHARSWYLQALDAARGLHDASALARSLNRLGNWYVNAEQPLEGRRYHLEALATFQETGERRNLAVTLDFLGVASYFSGDLSAGASFYERAVALYRELDDRQGLVQCLVMLGTRAANYLHEPLAWTATNAADCTRDLDEAIEVARQIGWRSAEAYALVYVGFVLGPWGDYARALVALRAGLDIAEEIGHRQWLTAAHVGMGALLLDLLALEPARNRLERARELAVGIGSRFSLRAATALLASTCVAQREFARADAVLRDALLDDAAYLTQAGRLAWCARAELELAQGRAAEALTIVQRLIATATRIEPDRASVIPRLWQLRSTALIALGRLDHAEADLRAAREVGLAQGIRPRLWRIDASLGSVLHAQGRRLEARTYHAEGRSIVDELAIGIPDEALRSAFLEGSSRLIPSQRPPTPRGIAKQAFDGLTEREQEIAALIAQGHSNRLLAEALVVSERTVAKHVENILAKLGLKSRAQIAAWAANKGMAAYSRMVGREKSTVR